MRSTLILCLVLAAAGCKKTRNVPEACHSFNRAAEDIGKCAAAPAEIRKLATDQAKQLTALFEALDGLDGGQAQDQLEDLGELCAEQEKALRELFSRPQLGDCLK